MLHTSGIMGKTDKATVYPTAMQAAQGLNEDYFSGQTGYNAHKTMHDLFNRSDETWSLSLIHICHNGKEAARASGSYSDNNKRYVLLGGGTFTEVDDGMVRTWVYKTK